MNRLAIVGSHPATRENAPWDDKDITIWVFNEAPQMDWCKRWDACFQMHNSEVYTSPNNMTHKGHWEWLQQAHGKTIYMQLRDNRVPDSVTYPLRNIISDLPAAQLRWFSSTPAYAMALAIHSGFDEISIYGVELSSNTEYHRQLPNWCYWLGVAMGAGITVNIESGQVHYKDSLYGYQGETQLPPETFTERADRLKQSWNKADSDITAVKKKLARALTDKKHEKAMALILELRDTALAASELSGALSEAERYGARNDPISRQEFERRAAQAQRDGEGHRARMYHAGGKLEYVWNIYLQSGNSTALTQVRAFIDEQTQAAFDCGAHLGIYRENMQYMVEVDRIIGAAGGEKTLQSLEVK